MFCGFKPDVEKLAHDAAGPVGFLGTEELFARAENRVDGELLAGLARGVEESSELLAGLGDGIRAIGGFFGGGGGFAAKRKF